MCVLTATPRNVRAAAGIIKKGGLVVYPTDTVYGLGCDPFNIGAVEKLIRVKGARGRPFPILAHSLENVEWIAELSKEARRIAGKFWPGPLTLILPKRRLPEAVTFGLKTVGVRIPNHNVALELVRLSGGLLVGTSANKTGHQPALTAEQASKQLKNDVDLILDSGKATLGVSSTVIDLTTGKPKVLRKGLINLENVLESDKFP
ncbi:MAG: L-threonylcarbamoyladenylate synthase [Candidatus Bathyarchaeia archaeon]